MKEIITKGTTTFRARCARCNTVFAYQLEDLYTHPIRGTTSVSCPSCGCECHHFGTTDLDGWPSYPAPKTIWTV